jgi:hypothetical protein
MNVLFIEQRRSARNATSGCEAREYDVFPRSITNRRNVMRTVFSLVATIFFAAFQTAAQEAVSVSTSTADHGGRYEIIQPPYDRTTTFRLDRYSGIIHRLATCPKDDSIASRMCWKEMNVVDLPRGAVASRPRYQIVINGPLKMIMLLQIETGQTWQYGIDPADKWYPFIECTDKASPSCLWKPFS